MENALFRQIVLIKSIPAFISNNISTITWLPRKLRGGIRCFREHGLRYTLRRTLEHLTGRA